MRLIDADALFEAIKRNDLEFMQQSDLMVCLKDIIDRQPTISKNIEIVDLDEKENAIVSLLLSTCKVIMGHSNKDEVNKLMNKLNKKIPNSKGFGSDGKYV